MRFCLSKLIVLCNTSFMITILVLSHGSSTGLITEVPYPCTNKTCNDISCMHGATRTAA